VNEVLFIRHQEKQLMSASPWDFGWNQLLTIAGLLITVSIAISGFRTFGRWKREKIEERRIEAAIDALALMYESKFVFEHIRNGFTQSWEWDDFPIKAGESDDERRRRGSYYAIWKRVGSYSEFFQRAWKLQVKCTAIFGPEVEHVFLLLQKARRQVEVAAEMLSRDPVATHKTPENIETWEGFHDVVWQSNAEARGKVDQVGKKLTEFRKGIKRLCRPIVNSEYGRGTPFPRSENDANE
jgi:hypothetical protein